MKRITDCEAKLFATMLRAESNDLYEMASGNWFADPTPEMSAGWRAESDKLTRIANRVDPPKVDMKTAVSNARKNDHRFCWPCRSYHDRPCADPADS